MSNILFIFVVNNSFVERLAKDDLLVNVHFSNLNIGKVSELYLFYRLRMYALNRGGSIKDFKFTANEKYRLLPELERLGWVKNDYVVNYRKLCNRLESVGIWVRMPDTVLSSIKAFKGFLIACSEAYILRRNNRIQERKGKVFNVKENTFEKKDWDRRHGSAFWLKVKKISLDGVEAHMGRVYVNTLEQMMGLSKRTISRWREESLNEYRKRYLTPKTIKSFRDQSMYYYSKSIGSLVTIDQYIISDLDLFSISKYSGKEYIYSYRNLRRRNREQKVDKVLHYYKTKM